MSEAAPAADALLGGALRLIQPVKGHRAGTDAVLLAGAFGAVRGRIADLGSSTGFIALALALREPSAQAVLIDKDAEMLELARRNIALNGLGARVSAAHADIFISASRAAAGLTPDTVDFVLTNPPFFEGDSSRASPDARRAGAHVMAGGDLAEWIRQGAALLRPGGRLALIHRADALMDVLGACAARLGALVVLPVHPRADETASRILVAGTKGSRAPLSIRPGLVLHGAGGAFTPLAEALHQGAARLDM